LNGTAARLGLKTDSLSVLPERSLEVIVATVADKRPDIAVIDSVQVVFVESSSAPPGSLAQLKAVTMALCETAKAAGTSIILIGHVTKSGDIAGPKALEHIVDTVLYLEGERFHKLRLLRATKNRFGSTNEVGVFEMNEKGMREIERPSELFLAERSANEPGSAVVAVVEGTRPILAEIQALTSPTNFAYPQRVVNGVDQKRLAIVLAVMEKRLGYELSKHDVFVNAVGGLKLLEPGADMALALAVASSMLNRPVASDTAAFGEVGLAGEVRGVGDTQKRVNEAAKMGFKRIIGPGKSFEGVKGNGAVLTGVENVVQAINAGLE
jgi:DNA repair protein RadA/Sms